MLICPNCDATVQQIDSRLPSWYWCPQCGTLCQKDNLGDLWPSVPKNIEKPAE